MHLNSKRVKIRLKFRSFFSGRPLPSVINIRLTTLKSKAVLRLIRLKPVNLTG
jgi:hypothetical protein